MIDRLAWASQAGVDITMNIRGICCLRPGVPGLTDRIRVFSIVGRFLEHARIFAFGVGDDARIYIGSADLMTRNTQRRVEIACPVLDPEVRRRIAGYIELFCSDNVKARNMLMNGRYVPVPREEGEPCIDLQAELMAEAVREAREAENTTGYARAARRLARRGALEKIKSTALNFQRAVLSVYPGVYQPICRVGQYRQQREQGQVHLEQGRADEHIHAYDDKHDRKQDRGGFPAAQRGGVEALF